MPPRKPCIERKAEAAINDGGPAFPRSEGQSSTEFDGMTLRDWFAGQALAGWLASFGPGEAVKVNGLAQFAYEIADALLAARDKRE